MKRLAMILILLLSPVIFMLFLPHGATAGNKNNQLSRKVAGQSAELSPINP